MKRIRIQHDTLYEYSEPVEFGLHKLFIRPRAGHDIRIESATLNIQPEATIRWRRDVYGNSVGMATIPGASTSLSICSEVILQHFEAEPLDFLVDEHAVHWPFQFDPIQRLDLAPFQTLCFPSDGNILQAWIAQFWQPGTVIETYTLLDNINKAIVNGFQYSMREAPGVQRPAETLSLKTGSCRDFANLFIETCRYLGLPARFVSGYLHCPESVQGHGSTHAWSEVFLPGAGWKGFDNTSGNVVGHDHIAVAVSRHPEHVPPISGALLRPFTGAATMSVKVDVVEHPGEYTQVQTA